MTENDTETPQDRPRWQDKTLKAAGVGYMIGDISMVTAGLARRGKGDSKWLGTVGGAVSWFLGGVFAARWGNPNPEQQLQIQGGKLEHYLKQKGVAVPDDVRAQSALLKQKSFLGHVSQFFYEHPSEMLNAMYAIGSVMLLHDGLKSRHTKNFFPRELSAKAINAINSDFWIGAIVLGGASTGLLVKEDPDARKKAEGKGPLEKLHAYIAEKPLRVTGLLYAINNIFLGTKAFQDYKSRHGEFAEKAFKPHYASTTQLAAYLFSNTMLLLSNRNQIAKNFSPVEIARLEDAAARVIAAQPLQEQQALLADVAHYMAHEKGIHLPATEIAAQLAEHVAHLTQAQGNDQSKWITRAQPAFSTEIVTR